MPKYCVFIQYFVLVYLPRTHPREAAVRDPFTTRFIVVPFRKGAGDELLPVEVRPASTSAGAVRVAHGMREQHAGVVAYKVVVDPDTGAMDSPKVLFQHGRIPTLDEHAAA